MNIANRQEFPKLNQHDIKMPSSTVTSKSNMAAVNQKVVVDFIGAEYQHRDRDGFAKRKPQGYNGSNATNKMKDGPVNTPNARSVKVSGRASTLLDNVDGDGVRISGGLGAN